MIRIIFFFILSIFLSGCLFTKTIYVPHGQAVRLRQKINKCKVWVKTKNNETIPSTMDIPEGWYCLPKE